MYFHQRQYTWLHWVAYLAFKNTVITIQDPWILVHELPQAKTVNLGNTLTNVIRHMGMVTRLDSSHFQGLSSFVTSLHST
jgi:hypothetical protein